MRLLLTTLAATFVSFHLTAAIHPVAVNADGSFTPPRVEAFGGDMVEWRFPDRAGAVVPVGWAATATALCTNYLPYAPADPNEFTGPLPRAVSGIFTLGPEEAPYTSQAATWASPSFTGVFIRPRWDEVHLGPGRFDWSAVDAEITQAVAHGKVFSLGFKAGSRGTPQWMFDPARTDAPVTPLDFGFREAGRPFHQGSPADPNFRKHYFDLLRACAAHLRERNAHYRALAYVKVSGLNLHTHENRLPNDTTEDLATWAGPGMYTPTALRRFYAEQTALLAAEFPGKDMSYALIQDGFPRVNDLGEYAGQPAPPTQPVPTGAEQTESVLAQGRAEHGLRFAVQHNGLQPKPDFCPGSGVHPVVVDPDFPYVGSGCPNRWVLAEAAAGQVTGYQDVAGLTNLVDLEGSFANAWDNSDGVFVEIYEGIALRAEAQGLPSGMTVGQWAGRLHERRRATFPALPDPFPTAHVHAFTRALTNTAAPQLHWFVDPSRCAAHGGTNFGVIAIHPDLGFTAAGLTNGRIHLALATSRTGMIRLEHAASAGDWRLLTEIQATNRFPLFTNLPPLSEARLIRAVRAAP